MSATHREAFSSLLYRIEMNSGFLAMVAQPGMGKTTLLFHLLEQLQPSAKTAFIFQTQCTSSELLRNLLNEFECPTDNTDPVRISQAIKAMLVAEASADRRCVLIIDEAQNLGPEVLETIRLLSNFETPRRKLLNIVLSGQSELGEMLARPELRQLRQRLSCIVRLERFSPKETAHYIAHRLAVAGYSGRLSELFSVDALAKIAELSEGVPRIINSLCFNALSLSYALEARQISSNVIEEAASDLGLSGERYSSFDEYTANVQEIENAFLEISAVSIPPAREAAEPKIIVSQSLVEPVVAEPEPKTDTKIEAAFIADNNRRMKRKPGEAALARGLVCLLVLLLTPAVDRPISASVSAKTIDSSLNAPSATAPVNLKSTARVKTRREQAKPPAQPLLRHARDRSNRSPGSIHLRRRAPVDLGLATFVPEPLLKSAPVDPMPVPARTPAAVNSGRAASAVGWPEGAHKYRRDRSTEDRRRRSVPDYVPPTPLSQPVPVPPNAAWSNYEEDVQLALLIASNGKVRDVGILRGHGELAYVAKQAAMMWRYRPARANGRPVEARIVVTVQFRP